MSFLHNENYVRLSDYEKPSKKSTQEVLKLIESLSDKINEINDIGS